MGCGGGREQLCEEQQNFSEHVLMNMFEDSQGLMVLYRALPYDLKRRIRTLLLALGKNLPRGLRVPLGGVVAAFLYSKNLGKQMSALRVRVIKQWQARLDRCIEGQARRVVDSAVCEGYDKAIKGEIESLCQRTVTMSRSVSIKPYFELSVVTDPRLGNSARWDHYVEHHLLHHMKARAVQLGVGVQTHIHIYYQYPTEGSSVTYDVDFTVTIRRDEPNLEDIFTFH
eukprot:Hpha_TRINITY_DN15786_c2_g13::TRINITY_DN15786_c2_g13_i1::g.37441::m.37441